MTHFPLLSLSAVLNSPSQVGAIRSARRRAALGLSEPQDELSVPEGAATRLPMLAVRRRLRGPAAGGWSLVMPARWVMPVWQALVFAGARAVGQREWHWAAADQVLGCSSAVPSSDRRSDPTTKTLTVSRARDRVLAMTLGLT